MSSAESQINLPKLSLTIFHDILQPITHDLTLEAFTREKRSRMPCPSCGAVHNSRSPSPGHGHYVSKPGLDIYGRTKQAASDSASYFECVNCSRKIASSRYAAHLERCLSGRGATRSKNAASSSSAALSLDSASPSSPYVTDDDSPVKATKRRKVGNGLAKNQQHAYGISTMPTSPASVISTDFDNQSDPGITGRNSEKTLP
ncbi:hypothetical protein V1514DRAFT_330792 [Lipomyces japonicus]|uniref:uncharacterized protein n=1 Tax=Lipomyces japonicus TaxID=56871 RepID=UPI0034CDFE7D